MSLWIGRVRDLVVVDGCDGAKLLLHAEHCIGDWRAATEML